MRIPSFSVASGLAALLACGCSGSSSSGPAAPKMRAVNGLDGVTTAAVTAGTTPISATIAYGGLSGTPALPYSYVTLGSQTISFANSSSPNTVLASTTHNFVAGDVIDVIGYGPTGKSGAVALYDDNAIPANSWVRFVNASPAAGSVDIFLTQVGAAQQQIATLGTGGVTPAQPSGTFLYDQFNVLSSNTNSQFQLTVYPAGKDNGTPLINQLISLPTNSTWTVVILDPAPGQTSLTVLPIQDNTLNDTAP